MNTDTITASVLKLSTDSPHDDVASARVTVDALKAATKDIDAILSLKLEEWIEANGDIVIGDVRYYVGTSKTVDCLEPARTLDAVFVACGGDMTAVGGTLVSKPFKHGACREILGDAWGEHFVEKEVLDVKEGKPKRTVQKFDARFSKAAQ